MRTTIGHDGRGSLDGKIAASQAPEQDVRSFDVSNSKSAQFRI